MLEIKLFGTGQACYNQRSLQGFPRQQPHLLLCYLLLNRTRPYRREQLAAVFWGEYPSGTSRKYLRNTLWRLRQQLETVGAPADEFLLVDEDSVSFSATSGYYLDVEQFETIASRYKHLPGSKLTPVQADQLEKAMGLCTGDLLSGTYQDWCLVERERLNLLHLNSLSRLMSYHEFNGNYQQGLACGEQILSIDNTRESVHYQMMRLHWHLGDRHAALVQYKRCAQILRETLNVSPMEATTRLYEQIISGQLAGNQSLAGQPGPDNADSPDRQSTMLANEALQRLQRLQITLNAVTAELRHISWLVGETENYQEDDRNSRERRHQDEY